MDRAAILNKLSEATDKAASIAIRRGLPISTKSGTWVGNTIVKKNSKGFYDVLSLDNKKLFTDIIVFDVATIIAQRFTDGEFRTIEKILILECAYSKHHTDMMHYLHCIKAAKLRQDYDTMAILEDKFQISEIRAKNTRDDIAIFKRLK